MIIYLTTKKEWCWKRSFPVMCFENEVLFGKGVMFENEVVEPNERKKKDVCRLNCLSL